MNKNNYDEGKTHKEEGVGMGIFDEFVINNYLKQKKHID